MLQASVLLALAILSWVDDGYMALMWGVEALLLLYMGLIFGLKNIRYEAYILMVVALLHAVWQCFLWLASETWDQGGLVSGWWTLLSIGLLIQLVMVLLLQFKTTLQAIETLSIAYLRETISGWLVITVLITTHLVYDRVELLVALPLMMLLLYRSARFQLPFTEGLAWMLWLLPLLQISISAQEVGSMRFTVVDWVGKLAYLESFALLWLVSTFYTRYYAASNKAQAAKPLRVLFYLLIPVCFLPGVLRHAPMWLPTVLWISATISFLLFRWKDLKALYVEQMMLSATAFASIVVAALMHVGLSTTQVLVSLCAGLAYFAMIVIHFDGLRLRDQLHPYRPLFIAALYFAGFSVFIVVTHIVGSVAAGLLLLQLYIAAVVWYYSSFQPIRNQLGYWYQAVLAIPLLMIMIVVVKHDPGLATLLLWPSVLLSLAQVHMKPRHFSVLKDFKGSHAAKLVFAHLCLLAVYTLSLSIWYHEYFQATWSVLLILHATLMLFESLWPRFAILLRVSAAVYLFTALKILLYDLHDLSMIEKVAAFVCMGCVLLFAAYFFQRLKTKMSQSIVL